MTPRSFRLGPLLLLAAGCLGGGVKAYSGDTQQARWDQHATWNGID